MLKLYKHQIQSSMHLSYLDIHHGEHLAHQRHRSEPGAPCLQQTGHPVLRRVPRPGVVQQLDLSQVLGRDQTFDVPVGHASLDVPEIAVDDIIVFLVMALTRKQGQGRRIRHADGR